MPIQPGLPMVLMGIGLVLCNLGFWSMYVVLMRRRALGGRRAVGSWRDSFQRFMQSFRVVETPRDRLVFRGGPVAVALGSVLCFSGVGISNARTNRPCVQSCREAGHKSGRVRGDPFEPGERGYSCWCYDGTHSSPQWVAK